MTSKEVDKLINIILCCCLLNRAEIRKGVEILPPSSIPLSLQSTFRSYVTSDQTTERKKRDEDGDGKIAVRMNEEEEKL